MPTSNVEGSQIISYVASRGSAGNTITGIVLNNPLTSYDFTLMSWFYFGVSLNVDTCVLLSFSRIKSTFGSGFNDNPYSPPLSGCSASFALGSSYRISIGGETLDNRGTNFEITEATWFYQSALNPLNFYQIVSQQINLQMIVTLDGQPISVGPIGTTASVSENYSTLQTPQYDPVTSSFTFSTTSKPLVIVPKLPLGDLTVAMWLRPLTSASGNQSLILFQDSTTLQKVAYLTLNMGSKSFPLEYNGAWYTTSCTSYLAINKWIQVTLRFIVHLIGRIYFQITPCRGVAISMSPSSPTVPGTEETTLLIGGQTIGTSLPLQADIHKIIILRGSATFDTPIPNCEFPISEAPPFNYKCLHCTAGTFISKDYRSCDPFCPGGSPSDGILCINACGFNTGALKCCGKTTYNLDGKCVEACPGETDPNTAAERRIRVLSLLICLPILF